MKSRGTHRQRNEANRPYIIVNNKKEKTCILIDVAIPPDTNGKEKEVERNLNTRVYV
jgi:hypothetical protein